MQSLKKTRTISCTTALNEKWNHNKKDRITSGSRELKSLIAEHDW